MKKIILTLLSILPLISVAQSFKPDENTVSSSKDYPAYLIDTVVASSYTKQQLYSNALHYVTSTFSDSRNVIELKDTELGEIALKAFFQKERTTLYFKCKIYVKDKKFKIVLSALETNHVFEAPEIKSTLVANYTKSKPNSAALALAVDVIKDIAYQLNKKPENEF